MKTILLMARRNLATVAVWAVLCVLSSGLLTAEKIPALSEVPDTLPAQEKKTLSARREQVVKDRMALYAAAAAYSVKSAKKQTRSERQSVDDLRLKYIDSARAFNQMLAETLAVYTNSPVVDLSENAGLVEASRLRLEQINGRIARLEKAIIILGSSNPEWAREWKVLEEESIEQTDKVFWNGLDLLTLGIAGLYEGKTEAASKKAEEVFQGQEFSELMRQKESLLKLRRTLPNSQALGRWIDELSLVEKAAGSKDMAALSAHLRECLFHAKDVWEEHKHAGGDKDTMKELYHYSTALGGFAVAFPSEVRGKVAPKVALPVQASLKLVEAGLRVKLVCEEEAQFNNLRAQSDDRARKKRELLDTKADLEGQASRLNMVMDRSKPKK